jgi:hypothetical protein
MAHLPSGVFNANAAWTVLWAIAHNLTRAASTLAGTFHARATTATIRAHLINVPARLARSARRITMHLPQGWLRPRRNHRLHQNLDITHPDRHQARRHDYTLPRLDQAGV